MDHKNKRAPGERGAGETLVCWDGRDSTTAATHDALRSHQRELFGFAARADERTMMSSPCSRCGATVTVVGPGAGPHHASLRCVRGHFVRWVAKPVGGAA
jgi:hypothetical protein